MSAAGDTRAAASGTALVTGATAGLGAEFARQLAARGHDLVLVGRDEPRLQQRRDELVDRFGLAVEVLPADLATDDGCAAVARRVAAEPAIEVLVNNAGHGLRGGFGDAPLAEEEAMLEVNVRAVLRLSHAAVVAMRPRGRGRILNIASVAGFHPRGEAPTYGASKAYVIALSEGMALSLVGTGVAVTAVCPGFTHTEFHDRLAVDKSRVPSFLWLSAEPVVRAALADADRGKVVSVPDVRYKAIVGLSRVLPHGRNGRPRLTARLRPSGRAPASRDER